MEKILEALQVCLIVAKKRPGIYLRSFMTQMQPFQEIYLEVIRRGRPDAFLRRNNARVPGSVDPGADGLPSYLLIVADRRSIPYDFSFFRYQYVSGASTSTAWR